MLAVLENDLLAGRPPPQRAFDGGCEAGGRGGVGRSTCAGCGSWGATVGAGGGGGVQLVVAKVGAGSYTICSSALLLLALHMSYLP